MALPRRLKKSELELHGFEIREPGKAKHRRYSSNRFECETCLDWMIQLTKGECDKCRRKKLYIWSS
jgi:hypothetical protein